MSVIDDPYRRLVSDVSARLATSVNHGASGLPVEEPRAVDDVRFAVEHRLDQRRELRRIELEVGVLDRDDVAARRGEPKPNGVPFSAIPIGVDDPQPRRCPRAPSARRAFRRSSRR